MLVKVSLTLCPFVVCSSSFCKALAVSRALLSQDFQYHVLLRQHQDDLTDTASTAPKEGFRILVKLAAAHTNFKHTGYSKQVKTLLLLC